MAKHLLDKDIQDIVGIIDDWDVEESKLTWDVLIESIELRLGFTTTRQSLSKKRRIATAFKEVKAIGGSGVTEKGLKLGSTPPSLKMARVRIAKRDRELERLKRENNELLEQFQVWLYNAKRFGITIEQLNESLPRKD